MAADWTSKVLVATRLADTSQDVIYVCPVGRASVIKHGTACNTSASAVTVTVFVTAQGGSARTVISSYSLAAHDTLSLVDYLGDCHMQTGDTISVQAGTGNVLDVVLSGSESP